MTCPVCGQGTDKRLVAACILFGLMIGFVGGQFFYAWQIKPLYKDRLDKLEFRNEELRKYFIPPNPKKGIDF